MKRFLLAGLVVCTLNSRGFGNEAVRTVALTGAPAVNTSAIFTRLLTLGELNDSGQTAFFAELAGAGAGANNDVSLWTYDVNNGLSLVLREGDVAPLAGTRFSGFGLPTLNNSGRLAFRGSVADGSTNYTAVWRQGSSGALTQIAQAGSTAPGTNLSFTNFGVRLSDNGRTVIHAGLNDPAIDDGLWRDSESGSLTPVYIERGDAPGTTTSFSSFGGFSMNNDGQIQLVSGLMDVAGGATQTAGIWRDGQNGLDLVARHGGLAPGTAAQFQDFGFGPQAELDRHGRTSFVGYLMGTGVNGTNSAGIWSERGGTGLELVIRAGAGNAPGTTARFESFSSLLQNSESQLAFYATLGIGSNATNDRGIWSERANEGLTLIAREGAAAPGTALQFFSFASHSLALNDNGQVAFLADVREASSEPRTPRFTGIWAQNRLGQLTLIALEGKQLNLSDDPSQPDLRTIASLEFKSAGFNDFGQLTFLAMFTDGSSGIFISDLVAVPEPVATLPLFFAVGLLHHRRRAHPCSGGD